MHFLWKLIWLALFFGSMTSAMAKSEQCARIFQTDRYAEVLGSDQFKIVTETSDGFMAYFESFADPAREVFGRIDRPLRKTGVKKDDTLYVALHGLTDNLHSLDLVTSELAARGKTVLRTDLFGHGESLRRQTWQSSNLNDRITVSLQARAVRAAAYYWMRRLGFTKIAFVGHSFGGGVAVKTASWMAYEKYRTGVDVEKVVLIEPYVMDLSIYQSETPLRNSDSFTSSSQSIGEALTESGSMAIARGGLFTGYSQWAIMSGLFAYSLGYNLKNAPYHGAKTLQTDIGLPSLIRLMENSIRTKKASFRTPGLSVEQQARGAIQALQQKLDIPTLSDKKDYDMRDSYAGLRDEKIPSLIFMGNIENALAPKELMNAAAELAGTAVIVLPTSIEHYPHLRPESANAIADTLAGITPR